MINVVTILMESITTWLCLHIVFGKKIEKRWMEYIFHVAFIVLFVLCSFEYIARISYLFLIAFLLMWCKKVFKEKTHIAVFKAFIGIVFVGLIELIVMFMFDPFTGWIRDFNIKCCAMSVITSLMSIALYMIVKKIRFEGVKVDKNLIVFTIIMFAFFISIKIEYEINRVVNLSYVLFFIVVVIAFLVMNKKQKAIYELEKRNLQIDLHNIYGKAYEDLLSVVRRRQHDYKNQLSAIHSMHLTASSFEELVEMQREYISILAEDGRYDKILTKCSNPIIAGYLYNECVKYSNEGIDVDIDASFCNTDVDTRVKDIIEIVGALLSNAYEYMCDVDVEKYIKLLIYDEDEKVYIKIKNMSEYVSNSNIHNMFKLGYSSKGDGRGVGLYSVKRIVDKYSGEVCVENKEFDHKNWLCFDIVI